MAAELRTPLYDWHRHQKARMVPFGGWDMPVQYTGIIDEHNAVRGGAGMFDISHMARLVLVGPQALDLIQKVWTNDAARLKPGEARYGLLCNGQGGILDDVLVTRFEALWLMVVNASNRGKVVEHLRRHADGLAVKVDDRTEAWAMVAVQGPGSFDALGPLIGRFDKLRYYSAVQVDGESLRHPVSVVSRTGYTGEEGVEVILPAGGAIDFADDLVRHGARPCGLGARDTLRLEAGMPLYGHELTEEVDPYTAGLGRYVRPDKGDFVGREALIRLREAGTPRRRVGLLLEGKRAAREGSPVLRGGRPVGAVTSGSFGPTVQRSIAMAYVDAGVAAAGTACEVEIRGSAAPAEVVDLPFYHRLKL